jgi:hypothetical protein
MLRPFLPAPRRPNLVSPRGPACADPLAPYQSRREVSHQQRSGHLGPPSARDSARRAVLHRHRAFGEQSRWGSVQKARGLSAGHQPVGQRYLGGYPGWWGGGESAGTGRGIDEFADVSGAAGLAGVSEFLGAGVWRLGTEVTMKVLGVLMTTQDG